MKLLESKGLFFRVPFPQKRVKASHRSTQNLFTDGICLAKLDCKERQRCRKTNIRVSQEVNQLAVLCSALHRQNKALTKSIILCFCCKCCFSENSITAAHYLWKWFFSISFIILIVSGELKTVTSLVLNSKTSVWTGHQGFILWLQRLRLNFHFHASIRLCECGLIQEIP